MPSVAARLRNVPAGLEWLVTVRKTRRVTHDIPSPATEVPPFSALHYLSDLSLTDISLKKKPECILSHPFNLYFSLVFTKKIKYDVLLMFVLSDI